MAAKFVAPNGATPKKYLAADFDKMVKETKPDCVIVTCPDAFHDDYIVRALDAGCDCITEKPLTTTPEKAQRIVDACKRNNRHVRVLFNYRYSPPRTQVKDLLMSGAIGDVMSVDFHWLLNTLARRGLFPPLAQPEGDLRRAHGPQGHASLRPGELVAGQRSRDS